jgi:hypothetical protein
MGLVSRPPALVVAVGASSARLGYCDLACLLKVSILDFHMVCLTFGKQELKGQRAHSNPNPGHASDFEVLRNEDDRQ